MIGDRHMDIEGARPTSSGLSTPLSVMESSPGPTYWCAARAPTRLLLGWRHWVCRLKSW